MDSSKSEVNEATAGHDVDGGATEQLTDHNYDGIQEYENPCPGWWNWLFVLSIVVSPIYVIWFHSPVVDRNLQAQYTRALSENIRLKFGDLTLSPDRDTLIKYMDDADFGPVGASTFETHCAQCHGKEGEGISAPNLTDEYFLHIEQIEDIAKVVQNGANNGAMPAWSTRLHPNEVVLVSSYVAALRGQNLSSTRKAEGKVIDPWPEAAEESADDEEAGEGEPDDESPGDESEDQPDDNEAGGEPPSAE